MLVGVNEHNNVCAVCKQKLYNYGFLIEGKMYCNRCLQERFRVTFREDKDTAHPDELSNAN